MRIRADVDRQIFIDHLLCARHMLEIGDTVKTKTEDGPCPPGAASLVGMTHSIITIKQLSSSMQSTVKTDSWVFWKSITVISPRLVWGDGGGEGSRCKAQGLDLINSYHNDQPWPQDSA